MTDSARAESQAPDSADRGGLLALAEARARFPKHSPPNPKFVNFGYARYTRAWRLRRFFAFLNCGSGLPLLVFNFPLFNHKRATQRQSAHFGSPIFFQKMGVKGIDEHQKTKNLRV